MRISRNHDLGRDEAKKRVNRIAGSLEQQYSLTSEWRGDDLEFMGTGVNGQIAVTDTQIDIDVTLGFTLMMMEKSIEAAIEDVVDGSLA